MEACIRGLFTFCSFFKCPISSTHCPNPHLPLTVSWLIILSQMSALPFPDKVMLRRTKPKAEAAFQFLDSLIRKMEQKQAPYSGSKLADTSCRRIKWNWHKIGLGNLKTTLHPLSLLIRMTDQARAWHLLCCELSLQSHELQEKKKKHNSLPPPRCDSTPFVPIARHKYTARTLQIQGISQCLHSISQNVKIHQHARCFLYTQDFTYNSVSRRQHHTIPTAISGHRRSAVLHSDPKAPNPPCRATSISLSCWSPSLKRNCATWHTKKSKIQIKLSHHWLPPYISLGKLLQIFRV